VDSIVQLATLITTTSLNPTPRPLPFLAVRGGEQTELNIATHFSGSLLS